MLGGRSPRLVFQSALEWQQYRAVARYPRLFSRPGSLAAAYLRGQGDFPRLVDVQTPTGSVQVCLRRIDDLWTLSEVFAREDYRVPGTPKRVVDLGANVGLSALYFATRGPDVRVRAFEPLESNRASAVENLRPVSGRVEMRHQAVGPEAGPARFAVEPTGRYGGIGISAPHQTDTVTVECRHVNDVLEEAIEDWGGVDLLKIDTEGLEMASIEALSPAVLGHVRAVAFEWAARVPPPVGFAGAYSCETNVWVRRP